jgi:hypothetical protein
LITPYLQIARALRLATHTSSGEEEAHSKAGGNRMTSSLFLFLFLKLT